MLSRTLKKTLLKCVRKPRRIVQLSLFFYKKKLTRCVVVCNFTFYQCRYRRRFYFSMRKKIHPTFRSAHACTGTGTCPLLFMFFLKNLQLHYTDTVTVSFLVRSVFLHADPYARCFPQKKTPAGSGDADGSSGKIQCSLCFISFARMDRLKTRILLEDFSIF
jgi:hypothetical protein